MGWIIATIIMAMDAAIGSSLSITKQKDIQEQAKRLAKQISDDRELVNNLYTAYQKQDANYANSLLNASPFSSFYKNTLEAAKKNDSKLSNITKEIERINKAESNINTDLATQSTKHQTSGSTIIDLIAGRATAPVEKLSYQTSEFNKKGE